MHRVETRVRYPETDRMGVAYHGHYLVWFELGRTEWMRKIGSPYGRLENERGIHFPVIEVGARYAAPARYDETIVIETRLTQVSGVRVRFEYRIVRPADGRELARGFTAHAAVGTDGKPLRLPADLRTRFEEEMHAGPFRPR